MCARRSLLVLATFAATVTASLAQERNSCLTTGHRGGRGPSCGGP